MGETRLRTQLIGTALWRDTAFTSLDLLRLHGFDQGYLFNGRVLAVFDDQPYEVHYNIFCDHAWLTREAHVALIRNDDIRKLQLRRDEHGQWWQDETLRAELHGIDDVDISVTPATNTLPIRRLSLNIGDTAPADAAWIRVPQLVVERLPQRYTRLSQHGYRYDSGNGAFTAELTVDDAGVVVRYGDLWDRIAPRD